MEECIIRAMDLKTRAADLDLDIPAMFPALKDKRIPLLTRLMAHRIFEEYRPREDVSMTRHWYYAIPVIIVYACRYFASSKPSSSR